MRCLCGCLMSRFYEPDLGAEPDSPFARDASLFSTILMNDRSLVMVMTNGIGAHLTNDEKRAHLIDLKRDHLIAKSMRSGDFAAREKVSSAVITAAFLQQTSKFHMIAGN